MKEAEVLLQIKLSPVTDVRAAVTIMVDGKDTVSTS